MDISTLRPGDVVELLIDAHPIPAGCYRFLEVNGEVLLLAIGKEVIIGLAVEFWKSFIRPVSKSNAKLTSERIFVRRYARLLRENGSVMEEFRNLRSFTLCMMSPRVAWRSSVGLGERLVPVRCEELLN